jgi:predicted nuclease of predicted toxin-antitoxin system
VDFLADESCDFAAVRALRADEHDVTAVAEIASGAPDDVVLELARTSGRILLTEDKDFGQLVYADQLATGGVILIRFPARARGSLGITIVAAVRELGPRMIGQFVVIQPGRARLS